MLKGKDLILATKPFAEEDISRSAREVIITVVLLVLSYVILLMTHSLVVQALVSVLLGLTLVRMFVLYHDFLHRSILRNQTWAEFLFTAFGLAILVPPSIWKRSHNHHHNHNSKLYSSSIGSFPIVTLEKYQQATRSEQVRYLFIRHPLTILFGYIFVFLYGMCIRSLIKSPKRHWDSILALLMHGVIIWVCFSYGSWQFLIFAWLVPNLIACAIGSYLFYAQHNFPTAIFANRDGWTYAGAAIHSSSYMKMNAVMQWFTCNIGFHHIHHLNARIPFYRLPEVFSTFTELQQPRVTSLHPKDIWSCLQLKVYDPNLNRMITKSEMV